MTIFLDIDGVMVPANAWKRPEFHQDGFPMFSSQSVQALKRILSESQAQIILTSSHKSSYSCEEWLNIFFRRGITLKEFNILPENMPIVNRKEEILRWFNTHSADGGFIIIDDDKSLNDLPYFLKDRLLLINGAIGLNNDLADKAILLLNQQIASVHA